MIDSIGRQKVLEKQKMNSLSSTMKDAISSAIQKGNPNEEILKLVVSKEDKSDEREISLLQEIFRALIGISTSIRGFKIEFPKIFNVVGKVRVDNLNELSDVKVRNLNELGPYFQQLGEDIKKISMALAIAGKVAPIVQVKDVSLSQDALKPLETLLSGIKTSSAPSDNKSVVEALGRVEEVLSVLANRPSMTTAPVTNININSLRGPALTTGVSVGTDATALPSTPLDNRRTLIIYNNSSATVYLGGADVTTSNGLPIPAGSYSPAIDAGVKMIIYGVVASGTADVRVLEVSMDNIGS
jgi:hypothetical protein